MPCKPIRRKYSSKNEVILPSDRRGSMACHAVPRVMMYQGDARVPLEAEAILRGLRWWRTEVWNNGCFVRLGRCGIVIWRLIAHYYYWAGTSGVRPPCCSALLFGAWHVDPVAICPTCRRQEVQNSWKRASTEEYKTRLGFLLLRAIHRYKPGLKKGEGGSFPARQAGEFGIVCSRQGGRKGNKQIKVERLSFGKIWFYGVRTH